MKILAKRAAALAAVATAATVIPIGAPAAASAVASPGNDAPSYDAACPPWYGEINLIAGCTSHAERGAQLLWQSLHPQEAGFAGPAPTS